MRAVLTVSLALTLAGCQSMRSAFGQYQRTADKGIGVRDKVGPVTIGGTGDPSPAPAGTATVESSAPSAATAKAARREALPTGLGGDTAHRAYTSDAPRL